MVSIAIEEGIQNLAPGSTPSSGLRIDRLGGLVVVQGGAEYQEMALRYNSYWAQTAATGVAPGTAIGTTAAFALANPAGSGVNLILLKAAMGYVSGTLGAGVVQYCASANVVGAAVTGTPIAPVPALIGNGRTPAGKPFTTATLPAAPAPIGPFASLGASLATTAVQPWQVVDDVKGAIAIAPGAALSLQATAAGGSTPLVVFGVFWVELPI